ENIAQRFSKIGSTPNLEKENINTVTADFLDYFQSRTSSKVLFIKENPPYPVYVKMNKYLFEWVLENLCKNAVDAMNGVGTITVTIYNDKQFACVEISDTGKGIAAKNKKNIFEPGYTTKSRGWGLGLTLAKRIINDYHHGKIKIKSSTEKGTTFKIKLKKE
ncbi:MAG: HAMP domain-containing histidine kinase, partial [Bacteroidales bacterium]|nr:HAMP domain-containing histidine kinase [Bacteroidales bacterium]